MNTIGNITVGKPDVKPSTPAHSLGVHEGNAPGRRLREGGIKQLGALVAVVTARRSTGIDPGRHGPIDPRMPVLTPA